MQLICNLNFSNYYLRFSNLEDKVTNTEQHLQNYVYQLHDKLIYVPPGDKYLNMLTFSSIQYMN